MNVQIHQRSIHWEEPTKNFEELRTELAQNCPPPGSLVVFAEMFATGFSFNLQAVGDEAEGQTLNFLSEMAKRHEILTVGSFPLKSPHGGKGLNRLVAVDPEGKVLATYDKIHPFSYGREADFYEGGRSLTVFEYRGWRICPTICYDLRFPEIYRRATLEGRADLFLCIANWPAARREHWMTLLRARAIENQAVMVAVNRVGEDPSLSYSGDSAVIDGRGQALLELHDREETGSVELSIEEHRDWRKRFPALQDATHDYELRCFPE